MAVIKDLNGNPVEAFDLIMTKGNAWDILNGKKCLELRSLSPFYMKRLLSPKRNLTMTLNAFEPKNIHAIHFHDYNNTWFLDCSCAHVVYISFHPNCLNFLHALKIYELDEEFKANKDKREEDCPGCFGLVIKDIYNTNLVNPSEIKATGGGFGRIPWVYDVIN